MCRSKLSSDCRSFTKVEPALLMLLTKLAVAEPGLSTGIVLDRGGPAFEWLRRTSLRRWPPTHWAGQGGVCLLAPAIVNAGE